MDPLYEEDLAQFKLAQSVTHFRIDGDPMPRVRFGDEPNPMSLSDCPECYVSQGQYHMLGCGKEICPLCERTYDCKCGYQGPIYKDL
jgi:hypothetical protein